MNEIRVTSLEGNGQKLDGGSMFGNAPRAVWEKWIPPDDRGRIPLACRCLLIECGSSKILCETGIGAFFEPKLADRYGVQDSSRHILLESLQHHGWEHSDIDFVILSHLHFDHAGGLLPSYQRKEQGQTDLLFPKAQYIVGQSAWERALHPHPRDKASFIPGLTNQLENSGRLKIISDEGPQNWFKEGSLSFFITHGHTPGQLHTVFQGPKNTIVFCGDLIPGLPWIHVPITMGYDRYPEKLIDEKTDLYKRANLDSWLFFFTHDPEVACAQIQKDESGRFGPARTYSSLERNVI